MTSPWSIPIVISQTIPSTAGPGQARIVIGNTLPPPLDTYVPDAVVLLATGFAGAIIFYSEGDDTTYTYLAVVEDGGNQIAAVIIGEVVSGVMQEIAANFPTGLVISADSFLGARNQLTAQDVRIIGTVAALIRSPDTRIASTDSILDILDTGITLLTTQAGADITLTADNDVAINSNINWAGATSKGGGVTASQGTTSTSYTVTGFTTCGTTFVAPPSGKVAIDYQAEMTNSVAAESARVSFRIREGAVFGAGTIALDVNDSRCIRMSGTAPNAFSGNYFYDTLTPGQTYNIEQFYRSSNAANTATFSNRSINVTPEL